MSSLVLMLMLQLPTTQFLVSTKAGLVNYVQGAANVKPATSVPAGQVIQTEPGGAVEILLNPGSYLRMGASSKVVLDRVELYDISVRILEGSMVITANGFNNDLPLEVANNSGLKMQIIKDGIYLFSDEKIVVVDGKLRDTDNGLVYGKSYQISNDQGYRAQKVKTFTTGLELWSKQRDESIARVNVNVARSIRQTPNMPVGSLLDVWLWWPAFGSFIYMPGGRYRSPYGYRYLAAGEAYSSSGGFSSGGSGVDASNRGSGSTSSGSSGGGGSSSSGGGSSVGFSSGVPASTGASSPTPSAGAQSGGVSSGRTATLGR
jgi:hypothetical protein